MIKAFKRLTINFFGGLFGASLNSEQKTVLKVITTLYIATGLSGTFVNIFLYSSGDGLYNVILYNTYLYFSIVVSSVIMGFWARRIGQVNCIHIGLLLYGLLYLMLLLLQEEVVKYSLILGIVSGFGSTFFHVSYNAVVFRSTSDRGRDYYMAVQGLILALVAVVAPLSAGFFIQYIGGTKGYLMVFSVTFVVLVVSAIIASRLQKQKVKKAKSYFLSVVLMPFRRKNFTNVTIGETIRGFREGAMFFMATVLLYASIPSTALVGVYTFMCSALQIFANYTVQKHMHPYNRKKFLAIGAFAAVVSGVIFLIGANVYIIFLYGIIASLTLPFYGTSTATIYYYAISQMANSKKRSLEGMATREFYLNIGRVVGIAALLLLPKNDIDAIKIGMAVLGVSQLLVWYFFNRADAGENTSDRGRV